MKRTMLAGVATLALVAAYAAAQESRQAKKYANVSWYRITNVAYEPGKAEDALKIVHEHFRPAGAEAGLPAARIFEYATGGEWNVTIVFAMPDGPSAMEWEVHPNTEKWMGALAKRLGGIDKARELLNEYRAMVQRSDSQIVRERSVPADADG